MEKEQFEELCSSYVLGTLGHTEEEQLFALLQTGDPELQKIFNEHLAIVDLLNKSIITKTPSPRLQQRLLKRINTHSGSTSTAGQIADSIAHILGFGNPRYGLTVSLLLLIVIAEITGYAYMVLRDSKDLERRVDHLEAELVDQRQRFLALDSQYEAQREIMTVLQSRTVAMVVLNGLDINPAGYGKIIWDPERKIAIIQTSRLPAAPHDKDYQLWFLDKEKKPVSAGVFVVNKNDENFFKVSPIDLPDNIKDISAFAVTMEPKGGVPQPTGTMYLLGTPSFN